MQKSNKIFLIFIFCFIFCLNVYGETSIIINMEKDDIYFLFDKSTDFSNIKHLEIHSGTITDFSFIKRMNNLEKLYLLNIALSDINTIIKHIHSPIKLLDLSYNSLTNLKGIEDLTTLEELIIIENKINDISGIEFLENLYHLDLSGNNVKNITELFKLKKIKWLNLQANEIENLKGINKLNSLTILNLSYNVYLTDIEPLFLCINLIDLNLFGCIKLNEVQIKRLMEVKNVIY